MTLDDLAACFEGIYPSALATRGADGMPNVTYLSHVAQVDGDHVAVSNQFFAKTAANIRADPRATLLLVDPRGGRQYQLQLLWSESIERGAPFDRMQAQLAASSGQVGLSDVMRLRAVDVFRVEAIAAVEAGIDPVGEAGAAPREMPDVPALARAVGQLSALADSSRLVCELLDIVQAGCSHDRAMVLLGSGDQAAVTVIASAGYDAVVVGAEVEDGDGLIGTAAQLGQSMRVNDLSRVRRMGCAVVDSSPGEEARSRRVALPSSPSSLSQIAVPMMVQGERYGVLFVESDRRLAFDRSAAAALEILGHQMACILALNAELAIHAEPGPAASSDAPAQEGEAPIAVVHHAFDESVFIDNAYVIKGLAGRLLAYMAERHGETGQREFTNRELRLAMAGVLPDYKDNLETRLLLLRRRLDALEMPIRLDHIARGRLKLTMTGPLSLTHEG